FLLKFIPIDKPSLKPYDRPFNRTKNDHYMQQFYSQSKRLFVSALLCFSVGTSLAQAYVVTKTADDGTAGTLRDAITQLNIGGFTSITFAFSSGTAPFTITLTSDLPQIINPVAIDGYSEASSVQGTIAGRTITVNIDGGGVANNGLDINASGSVVDGLHLWGQGQWYPGRTWCCKHHYLGQLYRHEERRFDYRRRQCEHRHFGRFAQRRCLQYGHCHRHEWRWH